MKFPHFFINRPIFAVVLSVLMLIAGAMAVFQLPLSEYPSVTPPTVQVTASYPGANPQVIADTVAAPLEQAVNGVEGMIYMASQTATDGQMVLTISFQQGIDPDFAQIQVQNRVSRALPRLPEEVQRIGVVTEKTSPDILMVVHMLSPGNQYDPLYVSNYSMLHVRDELARLSGVANVIIGGEGEYAMRVWLDPTKVASRGLTAGDVVAAIREQNDLITKEVDRHQRAIRGALLQHLTDSNSLIQAIATGYKPIVLGSQSEDFTRAEKKARPSSGQHP